MPTKKPAPTFIVRLIGPDLAPSKIPFRIVNAALSAVQDLASGRDPMETRQVPDEKVIGLVNVRSGSALYSCVSRSPDEARNNLKVVGRMLSGEDSELPQGDGLARTLKPIEKLSEVAKSMKCQVEVLLANQRQMPVFTVGKNDFATLSKRLFLEGETTVIGTVKRVGGSTDMKCALAVQGRRRLLFCDVATKEVVCRLGNKLYETITAKGNVTWIHSSWHIYKFTINDFSQPSVGNVEGTIKQLRDAGLRSWDKVSDPESLIRGMRT